MAFWLVETQEQLNEIIEKGYKKAFVEIIQYNNNVHPAINNLSLVYFKPLNDKGYMLCISHTESLSIEKQRIKHLLSNLDELYVRDKKTFLYHFLINKSYDINYKADILDIQNIFYSKHPNKLDINKIIPISKHYEYCENIFYNISDKCVPTNTFFNQKQIPIFYILESNGITINEDEFNKNFKLQNPEYSIQNDIIYTQYNFNTTTGRPSNRFNNINFAALNKENECRKSFIPKNNYLLEIDISAYHPTILSKLVGHTFNKSIYQEFAEYANISIPDAKILMFRQIYGGIYEKYKDWEFFKKVEKFVNELWEIFQTQGYIESPISKNRFNKEELKDITLYKLLNYLIQSIETENNVLILCDIFKELRKKNTKLILTVFDSFLFDIDESEEDLLTDIQNIFKKYNLNIKSKKGINYKDMEKITLL